MSSYKEIAEKAGVSIGTVYRVLHERGRFSPETARRVRDVAHRLGYKKNIYASNLSRSRSYLIALLMPIPNTTTATGVNPTRAFCGLSQSSSIIAFAISTVSTTSTIPAPSKMRSGAPPTLSPMR